MTNLNKQITRGQGIGLLATTLLGTGVFILPQITVDIAGANALYSWAGLTLAILPIVWVFSKLASLYAHAAGPAYFVEKAFGPLFGRVVGLLFIVVVPIGASAAMMMVMEFMQLMFSFTPLGSLAAQLLLLFSIWLLNIRGIELSATIQFMLTLAITAVVIGMIGLFGFDGAEAMPTINHHAIEPSAVLLAAGVAFWSFLGIEAVSHFSAEFKHPEKDFVPAMLIGTGLVGLLYFACVWLVLSQPDSQSLAMVDVFNQQLGQGGRWVIGILGVAAGLATINVYVGSVARLCWSLSKESVLPSYLSYLNQQQVPQRAANVITLAMAAIIIVQYALALSFELFLSWTNGVFVLIYAASMLAAFKLLSKQYRTASLCGLLTCIAVGVGLGQNMIYAIVATAIIYPLLAMQQSRQLKARANC